MKEDSFTTLAPMPDAQTVPFDVTTLFNAQQSLRAKKPDRLEKHRQRPADVHMNYQSGVNQIVGTSLEDKKAAYEEYRDDSNKLTVKEEVYDEEDDKHLNFLVQNAVALAAPSQSVANSPMSSGPAVHTIHVGYHTMVL
eukprot:scaffold5978_cov157-Amphora_coffeaeformis.AAC.5